MGVSVDGSEVIIQLDNISSNILPDAIRKALEQSCLIVEGDAKTKCPVDSGQLRQSINHKVEDNAGWVSTNVEYAPYVEIGTGIYSSEGGGGASRTYFFVLVILGGLAGKPPKDNYFL